MREKYADADDSAMRSGIRLIGEELIRQNRIVKYEFKTPSCKIFRKMRTDIESHVFLSSAVPACKSLFGA